MRLRRLPTAGFAVGIGLLAYGAWSWRVAGANTETPMLGVAASLLMGSLILNRRPRNTVGMLLILLGLAAAIQYSSEGYWELFGATAFIPDIGAGIALKIAAASGTLGFAGMLVFLPILFPDGRPHAPWARWLLGVAVAFVALQVIGVLLTGQPICAEETAEGRCLLSLERPPGLSWVPSPTEPPLEYVFGPLIMLSILGGLISAVARFRQSTGEVRAQMKWFAFAAITTVLIIPPGIVLSSVFARPLPVWVFNVPFILIPLGVAIAVLRYRLFDIDQIISRTVSYALVVGLLAFLVLGLVTLLAVFLPSDDPLVVAVSTLAAAAMFNPVRRRVQRVIDRRFNRSRYDAEVVMEDFAGSLRNEVDPEAVVEGLMGVVTETMQPSLGVWVREG